MIFSQVRPSRLIIVLTCTFVRPTVVTKAPLKVQFLLTFFGGKGEEQEALALLCKKGGREGVIESQQKFDFFCYDITPYHVTHSLQ